MKTSLLDMGAQTCAPLIKLHSFCLITMFRHVDLEVCGNQKNLTKNTSICAKAGCKEY